MNFQILGPLRVVNGDDREIALGGPKPSAILALLILNANEVVSADRLIEELWDGQPPPTAAKSLQVHISRLRRALGEGANGSGVPLVTRAGGYALDADPDSIDALRFERIVAEGSAALSEGDHALASARLRSALAMWRGNALSDFAYSSFAQDAIARLDGLRTVAHENAIEAELALGRHGELIPELRSLVGRHPLSERLRAQLMLALYRAGRQAEALGVYRAGRRVLVDQLGIEPSSDLRELERAILEQDPKLAAPEPQRRARRDKRSAKGSAPLFVGYEHELGALEDVLEAALVGRGRVALLSGEPGVGKTRLADELTRVANARGAEVLWARCWEGAESAPAFWPWSQVLRALVAGREPAALRGELADRAHDLAQLVPELGGAESPKARSDDPQIARFRLFEAVETLIRRAARHEPLVLVFDDLHAADPSTLSLLAFIGSTALNIPLLIVGTYRDTEVGANDPLGTALTELTRTSDCLQLVLTGLTSDDTAHFVELAAGVAPMSALAGAIHEATAGNPLFVTELVRLLRAESRLSELERGERLTLPRGVDQVIARRLGQLSDPCRRALTVAAVIGNEIDTALLQKAAGLDGDELLAAIEEAEAARVVEESAIRRGLVSFSHDLVRQALYSELGARERAHIHADVAAAIERLHSAGIDAVLAQLAHHCAESLPVGDPKRAVRYLMLAGDAAAELMAHENALSLYTRASEIAPAADLDPSLLSELYVKLAEQLVRAQDAEGVEAALARAEAVAGGTLAPALAGRAAIARAEYDLFDACLAGPERLHEVIELFERLDDPAGESRAWTALATHAFGHACFDDCRAAAERALEYAERTGSHALIEQALRMMAGGLAYGTMPASQAAPQITALLERVSNPETRTKLLLFLAELDARAGRFDEARARVADGRASMAGAEAEWDLRAGIPVTRIELLAGNAARAEANVRRACEELERRGLGAYLTTDLYYLADTLIALGRLDDADAALRRGAALLVETDVDAQHGQARSRARLELARGNLDAAEAAAREALAIADRVQQPDGRIDTLLVAAECLDAAGRHGEASQYAEEALALCEEVEHVIYAQRARSLLGQPAYAS
jgi:DNA-binding SARP family transcriptional activator